MSDRVCGAEVELQSGVLAVLRATPADLPQAGPGDIVDPLRCDLQSGHRGEHHALARGLPLRYPGEVWARWSSGRQPAGLMVITDDCPVRDPDDRDVTCLLFNGHEGAHSWLLSDPEEPGLRVWLDGVPPPWTTAAGLTSTLPPPPVGCLHPRTEKRDGKTYCAGCDSQLYL